MRWSIAVIGALTVASGVLVIVRVPATRRSPGG